MTFSKEYNSYIESFESYARAYFLKLKEKIAMECESNFNFLQNFSSFKSYQYESAHQYREASLKQLESMEYSFFNGGKRFRPVLSLAFANVLHLDFKQVLPWALAIEMVHTYSLIHDDLPCLDNDDYRRGALTNHKVYGEATALLSGDALLTMAFEVLSSEVEDPLKSAALTKLLSRNCGVMGMIGGQSTDLLVMDQKSTIETLLLTHKNKTSALLECCVLGAMIIASKKDVDNLVQKFGVLVGICFQLSDDLLDSVEKNEINSFVHYLGKERVEILLGELSSEAIQILQKISPGNIFLQDLVTFNRDRKN